jgi:hypothetical protein
MGVGAVAPAGSALAGAAAADRLIKYLIFLLFSLLFLLNFPSR